MRVDFIHGNALIELPKLKKPVNLIYIDPPFNTGKKVSYVRQKMTRDDAGNRTGYGGKRYSTETISKRSYEDSIDHYIDFIVNVVTQAYKVLSLSGSFFIHVDYREVHYIKVALDAIFGRANFMNEIIWSYDYGARSKTRWSCKHDTILWYAMDKNNYTFNYEAIDRIPYMAPALVGDEKAERGKTPSDVWWNSIVGTNSYERKSAQGYPTQKPMAILERIILVHSNEGDTVLDFFAGSGTTGVAALKHDRNVILIDSNKEAIQVAKHRTKF